jgi:membrane protein DedA with SNARE-associated domain
VFFGRLLPVIRTFISLPAGVARMEFWRFTVFTVLGCLPWTLALTWGGALLGANWHELAKWFKPISIVIAVALIVGIAVWVVRRLRSRKGVPSA